MRVFGAFFTAAQARPEMILVHLYRKDFIINEIHHHLKRGHEYWFVRHNVLSLMRMFSG